ncbi:hypothetical protein ACJX0J_012557 [Zea mays]
MYLEEGGVGKRSGQILPSQFSFIQKAYYISCIIHRILLEQLLVAVYISKQVIEDYFLNELETSNMKEDINIIIQITLMNLINFQNIFALQAKLMEKLEDNHF